jgi:hypothetical protein
MQMTQPAPNSHPTDVTFLPKNHPEGMNSNHDTKLIRISRNSLKTKTNLIL